MLPFNLTVPVPRHLAPGARLNYCTDVSLILDVHGFAVTAQSRSIVSADGEVHSSWSGMCAQPAVLPFSMDLELVLADWAVTPPAVLTVGSDVRMIMRDDDRLDTHHRLNLEQHLRGGA